MFDAIIVGARCAGAATAMLLARAGHKVLLVDKARFPSDIPHGHFIHWEGPRCLQRFGLLDRVVASNCPPITDCVSHQGDYLLRASDLMVDGVAWAYGPRRKVVDQLLIDAAIEAGAEFQDALSVDEFLADEGQVVGIRGRRNGAPIEARAPLTIGADGRNSPLARFVSAPEYHTAPPLTCYYFSYWRDVPHAPFETYRLGRRVIFAHSTNDDLFAVFAGWPVREHAELRSDLDGAFWRTLELAPDFAARVRSGRRVEPLYGAINLPNFFRKPYGPGWALVGDAGYHKDPYLAHGVSDALRDAEILSLAVHRGLSGAQPMQEALAEYQRRRDASALPQYQRNLQLANLEAPVSTDFLAIRAAVRDDPLETRRYTLALFGLTRPDEFFNPQNVERLLARLDGHGGRARSGAA
ncbi:MAG TPA: NAD(P)/FAD-dependent oxidoreductase [Polyangiaceae bacterium]|nr:NAD(P)/FAD-dependent oxidoreductase [Polyangiaceae bacterium]